MPPPVPPSVNDGRRMTGKPILLLKSMPSFRLLTSDGLGNFEADLGHRIFEEQAVFALLDGVELRADELRAVLFEDAAVGEFDGEIESGLSADGGKHGEDAGASAVGEHFGFDADDLFEIGAVERLDVGAVGHLGVGHDGGRVGVHQHHFVAFGLERLAGLRAGVVELGGLADDDGAGAEDEDFRDVVAAWHGLTVAPFPLIHHLHKILEEVVRVVGPGAASGWYCTLKSGSERWRRPSSVLSFRSMCVRSTSLCFSESGSTAKL